jgi:hypothetical protein
MAGPQRRARQLSIIAVVVGLHLAIGWMLLATTPPIVIRSLSQSFELVFVPPIAASESTTRKPVPTHGSPRPVQQRRTTSPAMQPETEVPSEEGNATQPPIDWAGELERAARDSAPPEPLHAPRDFGFPHPSSPSSPKRPGFGWSYAPTHRVESLPGGGLLVNLNDNCVLVFAPLPFFFCSPGKKPANGDLFKHLRDPSE